MASSLALQLRTISLARGGEGPRKTRGRPSLLFDPKEAEGIDLHTIYDIARAGLAEISAADAAFVPFQSTLFGINSLQVDREQETAEVNQKWNTIIQAYLRLLSGYLLRNAAHQTLEYLFRHFDIHIHNVDDVMMCIFPYHETNIFVRILQLLHIKGTKWEFLEAAQKEGASIPREVLAKRCAWDFALLEAVCEMAKAAARPGGGGCRTTITVSAVLVIEAMAATAAVSNAFVLRILPYILHGLRKRPSEELEAGSMMIVMQLANRATLSEPLLNELLVALAMWESTTGGIAGLVQDRVKVMLHLSQTQKIKALPPSCFSRVIEIRELPEILADLAQHYNTKRFLDLLLPRLLQSGRTSDNAADLLFQCIRIVPMAHHVPQLASMALEFVLSAPSEEGEATKELKKSRENMTRVIQLLEQRYPVELDSAMNLALEAVKPSGENDDEQLNSVKEKALFDFLTQTLGGSLHVPLIESHSSLYLSIDHPQARIREVAVRRVLDLLSSSGAKGDSQMLPFIRGALQRRLADDDWSVVKATLSQEVLGEVLSGEVILKSVEALLERGVTALVAGTKDGKKGPIRAAMQQALKLLSTSFLELHPELLDSVAILFLGFLLVQKKTRQLNIAAISMASELKFFLFSRLKDVLKLVNESVNEGEAKLSKAERRLETKEINDGMLSAMAMTMTSAEHGDDVMSLFGRAMEAPPRSKIALLLVLQCHLSRADMDMTALKAVFALLRSEWNILQSTGYLMGAFSQLNISSTTKVDLNGPSSAMYQRLERQGDSDTMAELVLWNLRLLIEKLPERRTEGQKESGPADRLVEDLFLLLAGAKREAATSLIATRLLQKIGPLDEVVSFLTKFFVADGGEVPALVQMFSLNTMAAHLTSVGEVEAEKKEKKEWDLGEVEAPIVPLLAALMSPLKAVRRAALSCASCLLSLSSKLSLKEGSRDEEAELSLEEFQKFTASLINAKEGILGDRHYLREHFRALLSSQPDGDDLISDIAEEKEHAQTQFSVEGRKRWVRFLVVHSLGLCPHGRLLVLSSLHGVGHDVLKAALTQPLLQQLLERRKEFHLKGRQERDQMIGHIGGQEDKREKGPLTEQDVVLLQTLLEMYTPDVGESLNEAMKEEEVSIGPLMAALEVEGGHVDDDAVKKPAVAAASCIVREFYVSINSELQGRVFGHLLLLLASDVGDDVRSAAKSALAVLPVSAATVAQHLNFLLLPPPAASSDIEESLTASVKKKKKKAHGNRENGQVAASEAATWPPRGKILSFATALLEFLQWEENLIDRETLIPSLQQLLSAIVVDQWPGDYRKVGANGEEEYAGGAESGMQVLLGVRYIKQLILMLLEKMANSLHTIDDSEREERKLELDVRLAVQALVGAQEAASRNHATALLAAVARLRAPDVLTHALEVLTAIGASSLTEDESFSHRAVHRLLEAILPPWLQESRDLRQLLQTFVDALPGVPMHRRLSLITSVLRTLEVEIGLPLFVQLLLEEASRNYSGQKSVILMEPHHGVKQEEASDGLWAMEFAAQLVGHYPPGVQLAAMVALLEGGERGKGRTREEGSWLLQQVVTDFVAKQLQSRSFTEGLEEEGAADAEGKLQESYVSLLEQVLLQLQTPREKSSAKSRKAALEATYALLSLLNDLMAPQSYLRGISSLLKHEDTLLRRKVLRLVAGKVREGAEAKTLSRRQRRALRQKKTWREAGDGGKGKKQREIMEKELLKEEGRQHAALASDIAALLVEGEGEGEGSALTRQAALQALEVLARRFGTVAPKEFGAVLPLVVGNLQHKSKGVVSESVRCIAAMASPLGASALPYLPKTMPPFFKVAKEAVESMEEIYAKRAEAETNEGEGEAMEGLEEERDGKGEGGEKEGEELLELVEVIYSAMETVVGALGAFLTPYLADVVDLAVLRVSVLACKAGGVAAKAAAVRSLLAEKFPARILLDPLFSAYPGAIANGPTPLAALMGVLEAMAKKLDRPAVASYHVRIFDFLLRALDLRRKEPPSFQRANRSLQLLQGSLAEGEIESGDNRGASDEVVEHGTVSAFAALVMKLSENTFKPLFIRTLEWAQTEVLGGEMMPPGGSVDRNITLYGVVNELTSKLRSVFVPYFRYLVDNCIGHLAGRHVSGAEGKGLKKRSKKKARLGEEQPEGMGEGGVKQWQLRFLVVTALHSCFLYDTVGFLDAPLFQRLLEPIVLQIDTDPPKELDKMDVTTATPLMTDGSLTDGVYAASRPPTQQEMDSALVTCLGQMALTAGSDVLWKQLNYQVLMCTRSERVRARTLGLEVVSFLVERLREEYLVLLPETIPFLAELLEDSELTIVAKTQTIVKSLEQLSGEDLTQYF